MTDIRILNNRYKVLNLLSASQKGAVYICLDQVLGLTRIMKESKKIKSNENGEFEVLRNLQHIGLPNIFDIFEDAVNYYVIIEHIEGKNIKEQIECNGVYSLQDGLVIIKQLLLVVSYLHTLRPTPIIHGDIKPENIMVSEGRTVLIDFASVTSQKGSSSFVSPERLLGMKKNRQSDIYSIGLIMYYLFTGKIKRIFADESTPKLNDEIREIIEQCTKKNSKERYKDIGILLNDIEKVGVIKQKENHQNRFKIISIHNNSQLAGELSYTLSKNHKKETLLIDSNIYESEIEYLVQKNKCKLYLQDFLYETSEQLYKNSHNKLLSILPCRADLESYENFSPKILEDLVIKYSKQFDVIIINCTDFIYDALCIKSIYLSDIILYSIKNGIADIRKYNSIICFLSHRQQISINRFAFVQFNMYKENIRKSLTSKAVEARWLMEIPFSKKRNSLHGVAGNYPEKMENKMIRRYGKLIKLLTV